MSTTLVNVFKVGTVVVIYLFLWYVARSIRAQIGTPKSTPKAPRPSPATAPTLVIVAPEPVAGRTIDVRRILIVGRGDTADFAVDDEFASERHARFEVVDGALFVDDLGSTNGTFVNGERIERRTPLATGDTVRVGGTIMETR